MSYPHDTTSAAGASEEQISMQEADDLAEWIFQRYVKARPLKVVPFDEMRDKLREALARRAAAPAPQLNEKDAERYRVLRTRGVAPSGTMHLVERLVYRASNLDAWVDALRKDGLGIASSYAAEGITAGDDSPFQHRVQPWLMACFGPEIAGDREERNHRFLEEALELVQACGCTASEAHQLTDYVFGRPAGDPQQECGGVMVTLAALCLANGLDMHEAAETELTRIWTCVEKIRAKQAAKPKHSPLPEATIGRDWAADMIVQAIRAEADALPPDGKTAAELLANGPPKPLTFSYRNHRGQSAVRHVLPLSVSWYVTPWHPEPQWLLRAYDIDKQAEREFAMRDMSQSVETPYQLLCRADALLHDQEGQDAAWAHALVHQAAAHLSNDPKIREQAAGETRHMLDALVRHAAYPDPAPYTPRVVDYPDGYSELVRADEFQVWDAPVPCSVEVAWNAERTERVGVRWPTRPLPADHGWRPIDSAPADTKIQVCQRGWVATMSVRRFEDEGRGTEAWTVWHYNGDVLISRFHPSPDATWYHLPGAAS